MDPALLATTYFNSSLVDALGTKFGVDEQTFDFTLYFEQTLLSIGPSALLLVIFPIRLVQLLRSDEKAQAGRLLTAKLSLIAIFAALQLTLIVLWSSPSMLQTHASVAAASLSLIDALAICALSYFEHMKSIRPSTILNVYLFFSVLFDIAQTRTLWLYSSHSSSRPQSIAVLFTSSLALKAILLVLEASEKRSLLLVRYNHSSPESTSSIFGRSTYWWLNSLFYRAYKRILVVDELWELDDIFSSESLGDKLQGAWDKCNKSRRHPLMRVIFSCFKWPFYAAVIPRLCFTGFTFAQPFLINRATELVSESWSLESRNHGYGIIGATAIIYLGLGVSRGMYNHATYRFITMCRGALISVIYAKATDLALGTVDDSAAVTHMSTDIDSIATGITNIHEIWASVIEMGIGLYLLASQVGVACIFVAIPSIVCSILVSQVAKKMGPARMTWNRAVQKRVAVTSSTLHNMKGIKLTGLTQLVSENVQSLRTKELNLSKDFRVLNAWLMVIGNLSYLLAPTLVIAAAVFWTKANAGEQLSTASAFTTLSVVVLVSLPLTNLIGAWPNLVSAAACFNRVQTFLLAHERQDHRLVSACPAHASPNQIDDNPLNGGIELQTVHVPSSEMASAGQQAVIRVEALSVSVNGRTAPLLKDINVSFRRSTITVVTGPVGSGKSTLLKAILGEIAPTKGFVRASTTNTAYCDQSPWLPNATIRAIVVGPRAVYDEPWYSKVIHACALEVDLSKLSEGDESIAGSGGITLSGGQKQRLALARAIYSREPLIILDGIFSALDNATSYAVFSRLCSDQGLFRELGSTVILATHNASHLRAANHIIVLAEDGSIAQQGRLSELRNQAGYIKSLLMENIEDTTNEAVLVLEPKATKLGPSMMATVDAPDSRRRTGDYQSYQYYFKSIGLSRFLVFLLMAAVFMWTGKISQIFLRIWTEQGTSKQPGLWFTLYAMCALVGGLAAGAVVYWWWIVVIPHSAGYMHQILLTAVMRAPLSFFSSTDSGITLNRFSQDMTLIDQDLPRGSMTTTFDILNTIGEVALIASGAQYVAAIIPICAFAIYFLQKYYLRTSRQIRHLDLETKAPLYTHFVETLGGLATIRAFGWPSEFRQQNTKKLDVSQKPYYLMFCIQRWLTLVLDLFVAGIALVLVAFAVNMRSTTSSGAIGLAMLNLLGFNQSLSRLINSWTALETSLGAINRIKDFVEHTPSEDRPAECQKIPAAWPATGSIKFENVTSAYSESGSVILDNVSFAIEAGQKIGICGRTGSGKSSLVSTLLRLLELRTGIINIDGVDISTIPRQLLRSNIICLPQDPVLLPGTVRFNIDPRGRTSDEAIMEALEQVRLWYRIVDRGGLDADMESLGLSHGERQLFCLCSAILRKDTSSVLILDEATSNVDDETDMLMQRLIKEQFAPHTVLAVAHRLDSIVDSDMILVLGAGRVLEFAPPSDLLSRESAFKRLYDNRDR